MFFDWKVEKRKKAQNATFIKLKNLVFGKKKANFLKNVQENLSICNLYTAPI
jgi:hypothetical protein